MLHPPGAVQDRLRPRPCAGVHASHGRRGQHRAIQAVPAPCHRAARYLLAMAPQPVCTPSVPLLLCSCLVLCCIRNHDGAAPTCGCAPCLMPALLTMCMPGNRCSPCASERHSSSTMLSQYSWPASRLCYRYADGVGLRVLPGLC